MASRFFFVAVLLALLLPPAYAGQAAQPKSQDGEWLFNAHCASCHGVKGVGGIGLPLSKPSVIKSLTDDYIRYTIRVGRPGRLMPSFSLSLNDTQINAIIRYMRSWGAVDLVEDKAINVKGDVNIGKHLYQEKCARCHGENMEGSKEGTGVTFSRHRALPIMPPALNNPAFQEAISDQALLHVIQEGREGTPMPAFKQQLSQEDTHHLIAYVRSKKKEHKEARLPDEPLTFFVDSPLSFEDTVKRIQETVRSNNFRVFPKRFLQQGLTDEFSVNKRQVIIRFCNFNKLYGALKIEPRLGTILPCKITVIEKPDGTVQLVYANIKMLSTLFNNDRLIEVFQEIEKSYNDIVDEVTL